MDKLVQGGCKTSLTIFNTIHLKFPSVVYEPPHPVWIFFPRPGLSGSCDQAFYVVAATNKQFWFSVLLSLSFNDFYCVSRQIVNEIENNTQGQSFQGLVSTTTVYNISPLNASQPTHSWHASVRNISFSVGWSCDKASPAEKRAQFCLFWVFVTFLHVSFPFSPTWSMSVGLVVKSFLKREMGSGYGK